MTDTTPEIAAMVHRRLMALSGAERLEMGARSFVAARDMILASLPLGQSDVERRRALYQRVYGEPGPAAFPTS